MNRLVKLMCVQAMCFEASIALARVEEDTDRVRENVVSSAMKHKRSGDQADIRPIQFAVDVNGKASDAQRKLSADLLVRSAYYYSSVTSTPTKAMLNSLVQTATNEMVNCEIQCEVSDSLFGAYCGFGRPSGQ